MKTRILARLNAVTAISLDGDSSVDSDVIENAQAAAEYMETELSRIFSPDKYTTSARVAKILVPTFSVAVYNVPVSESKDRLKIANASTSIVMMMHLHDAMNRNKTLGEGNFSIDIIRGMGSPKKAGVKWRKISGKTPMEVAKKTIIWFKKNSELIESVYDKRLW